MRTTTVRPCPAHPDGPPCRPAPVPPPRLLVRQPRQNRKSDDIAPRLRRRRHPGRRPDARLGQGHEDRHPGQTSPEARRTLELIAKGGPFPYPKDGTVFGNYENRLPKQQRGYYHEYTVPTPDARNRGARRIVTGGHSERYYTGDHYKSFEAVVQP
ncbi:ribonuclease domain-containing protein [Streptomyces sp. CA-181903]|uniref:ribonuclease domain-containing protein n=1 Tax=Streptomyces sp. CA-181903 TaxID=3240055 RepID=UPI003D8C6069